MRARLTLALLLGVAAACSGTSSPKSATLAPSTPPAPSAEPAEPAEPTEPTEPTESVEVLTPEQCTEQGGQVRGDIGDGQIACAEGERDLGRVRYGIEGGVCCAPEASP